MSAGVAREMETSAPLDMGRFVSGFEKVGQSAEHSRREVSSYTCQDSDQDLIISRDFAKIFGDLVKPVFALRIEFLWIIEGYNGDRSAIFEKNGIYHG